jgi:5-methylcytosine-specific restriction endonuclease McrA
MSNNKKIVREQFRNAVFERDKYTCVKCGFKSSPEKCRDELDAHHIQDRNLLLHGGYVEENGITLCKNSCHEKAEAFHSTGTALPGYSVEELFQLIGSSLEKATKACERLK